MCELCIANFLNLRDSPLSFLLSSKNSIPFFGGGENIRFAADNTPVNRRDG